MDIAKISYALKYGLTFALFIYTEGYRRFQKQATQIYEIMFFCYMQKYIYSLKY